MTENATAKYLKLWFRASLLINFGRASVVVSVAHIKSFSDLVLFQLKRTCLQKFKKSYQKKKLKRICSLLLKRMYSNLHVSQPAKG